MQAMSLEKRWSTFFSYVSSYLLLSHANLCEEHLGYPGMFSSTFTPRLQVCDGIILLEISTPHIIFRENIHNSVLSTAI
jgi:hypothetical protein